MSRIVPLLILVACVAPGCSREPAPAAVKPNVLLVTIDTLRADRVGRGLTPAIDGVAARGVRFTNARATAPLTLPSHVSILSGALPQETGVRVNGVPLGVRPTLARAFHDAGYRTAAFVGAYVLDRRFGLSGGFDTYDDRVPRDPSGAAQLEAQRRGDVVVSVELDWLGRGGIQPFFASNIFRQLASCTIGAAAVATSPPKYTAAVIAPACRSAWSTVLACSS